VTKGEISFAHMDNGNLGDTSDYTSNRRNTFGGRLMVYVRIGEKKDGSEVILKTPLGDIRIVV